MKIDFKTVLFHTLNDKKYEVIIKKNRIFSKNDLPGTSFGGYENEFNVIPVQIEFEPSTITNYGISYNTTFTYEDNQKIYGMFSPIEKVRLWLMHNNVFKTVLEVIGAIASITTIIATIVSILYKK